MRAAWRLFSHDPLGTARLAAGGARALGVRGLILRAAAARQLQNDDARYARWLEANAPRQGDLERLAERVQALDTRPLISIVTPVFDTSAASLRRSVESVRAQIYPAWQLCLWDDGSTRAETAAVLQELRSDVRIAVGRFEKNQGISAATNAALGLAAGDFIAFLDHDDELTADALAEIALALVARPDLDIVYSDEDKIDERGVRSHPHFKPDWSPEWLRACMYVSHLTVMRRQLVLEAGGFRSEYDGAQDYDLMLRAVERTTRIAHVPKVLYHWGMTSESAASSRLAKPWAIAAGRRALEDHLRRLNRGARVERAEASGHYRIRYAAPRSPRISILLTCAGSAPAPVRSRLARAIAARDGVGGPIDLVVAYLGQRPASWTQVLDGIAHRAVDLPADRPRTIGAALNACAVHAQGEYLVALDAALECVEADWLQTLAGYFQWHDVGAVGPVLLQADDTIDSAGLVVGCGGQGSAGGFHGEPRWTWGHAANARHARECAALDVACVMTTRAAFERVHGFDETLAGRLLSVDFGLRLREAGLRVLVTPYAHARWTVARSAAGETVDPAASRRAAARWGAWLDEDPYYNVNFDRTAATFRLPPI